MAFIVNKKLPIIMNMKGKIVVDKHHVSKCEIGIRFNISKSTIFIIFKYQGAIVKSKISIHQTNCILAKFSLLWGSLVWIKNMGSKNMQIEDNEQKGKAKMFIEKMNVNEN